MTGRTIDQRARPIKNKAMEPKRLAAGDAERALKRLLANGRLTSLPKRPADQQVLAVLAAAQLDSHRSCVESEVNAQLGAWLEVISEPFGIDHVTLRRMLVDSGFLKRTHSGSAYKVNADKLPDIEAVKNIDPAEVLAQVREERDARKRKRPT
jgi:hypothetical protein